MEMTDWSARVIFCDDIRQEFNGKVLLIGIYQGLLVTPSFPFAMMLSTYVDIRGVPAGLHTFDISAQYESEEGTLDLGKLPHEIDVRDGTLPVILQGGGMNLVAQKPGEVKILLSVDSGRQRLIDTLRISLPLELPKSE
jgi:hypothetical protein